MSALHPAYSFHINSRRISKSFYTYSIYVSMWRISTPQGSSSEHSPTYLCGSLHSAYSKLSHNIRPISIAYIIVTYIIGAKPKTAASRVARLGLLYLQY